MDRIPAHNTDFETREKKRLMTMMEREKEAPTNERKKQTVNRK